MRRQKVFSKIKIEGNLAHLYGRRGYAGYVRYDADWCVSNVVEAAKAKNVLAGHPVVLLEDK